MTFSGVFLSFVIKLINKQVKQGAEQYGRVLVKMQVNKFLIRCIHT